ncbi:MAG: hypothetical protein Q8L60_12420 [Gammaproteobacteria bacterium]|nr:hypothetical protein [Gammaproteobacteria bacterium]MDP2346681.1 hypothetical protein [Gammaproteobacteria bacterium]
MLPTLRLDLSALRRGVNNYHIDVRISPKFTGDVRRLVTALMTQATSPNPQLSDHSPMFNAVRASYLDMMTVLLHRVKTDLSTDAVRLLEFAVLKLILATSRSQLDENIDSLKERSSDSQEQSSGNALTTNQRLFWLQKNYDAILLEVNSQIFAQLERVESRQLRDVRIQYLPLEEHDILELRLNPMLLTSEPGASAFLIDQYRLWGGDGEDAGFNILNADIEKLFGEQVPETAIQSLLPLSVSGTPELYDELGGLFQTQKFMGMAIDSKSLLTEEFSWLDRPVNLDILFNIERQAEALRDLRRESGLGAWWQERKRLNRRRRILRLVIKQLKNRGVFKLLLASKHVKRLWSPTIAEQIEGKILCQFLSGQINAKKLQSRVLGGKTFSPAQLKQFESIAGDIKKEASARPYESVLGILQDISRFRLHLKYFRLAHRAFNRVKILRLENELTLSREAGSLYNILTAHEQEDEQDQIVHHAIIKADVRGSTTVTEELQNKSLNPASYFSLRFFSPINKLLPIYGANKVFIEGDAVILSFLEHEKSPQQWFAVARACGLAKAMLNIVHANNRHSEQMGLPKLELGIGLCYADNPPLYLYDEDKPIMISGAIGKADRLSSCTWKLRKLIQPGLFNVEVFALADGELGRGEKGQNTIRYNVNGILMDAIGFEKLQKEIILKRITAKINGETIVLHTGKYPDLTGRMHDVVIREGQVGLWKDDAPVQGGASDERFYEVVTNRKLISQVCAPQS